MSPRRNRSVQPDLGQALGHAASDKRIEILRRLAEVGSISQAARDTGISYKAAWQAIETLGNLAGTPMVEKAVGGAGGGGARLTAAGRQVLSGADLHHQARRGLLQALDGRDGQSMSAGVVALGLRTSMRNHLPCRVLGLQRRAGMVRVLLDLGEGQDLAARITVESAQLLGLVPGLAVLALCKATGVQVAAALAPREGANLLQGVVTRCSRSASGGEVSIRLASAQQLVGFAGPGHGLKVGHSAQALIDESAVVAARTD